jgi:hypothetical protein
MLHGEDYKDGESSGVWMWNGSVRFEHNRIENNGASGIFIGPQRSLSVTAP